MSLTRHRLVEARRRDLPALSAKTSQVVSERIPFTPLNGGGLGTGKESIRVGRSQFTAGPHLRENALSSCDVKELYLVLG